MRRLRVSLLLLVGVVAPLAGCGREDADVSAPRPPGKPLVIVLHGRNGTDVSGEVTLPQRRASAVLVLRRVPKRLDGQPLPAHIHRGSCAADTKSTAVAARLADVVNGRSETDLRYNWVASTEPFSIDVHEPRPPFDVVACGDSGT